MFLLKHHNRFNNWPRQSDGFLLKNAEVSFTITEAGKFDQFLNLIENMNTLGIFFILFSFCFLFGGVLTTN